MRLGKTRRNLKHVTTELTCLETQRNYQERKFLHFWDRFLQHFRWLWILELPGWSSQNTTHKNIGRFSRLNCRIIKESMQLVIMFNSRSLWSSEGNSDPFRSRVHVWLRLQSTYCTFKIIRFTLNFGIYGHNITQGICIPGRTPGVGNR